jgi:hypothetical protein
MEDKNQFEKYKGLGMLLSMVFLLLDVYYFNYRFFYEVGLHHVFFDSIIKFVLKMGFLNSPFYPKLGVILMSVFFVMLDNGKKNVEIEKKEAVIFGISTTILFLSTSLIVFIFKNVFLYSILVLGSYALLIKSYHALHRLFDNTLIKDRYNKVNKIFPQNTALLENELSVNIPFKFVKAYNKKMEPIWEDGYINFVAPERATLILGKPGSGKSYSFNEEFIRQWILKGFAFINYDYKFPTLTNFAYYYFEKYKSSYSKYENKGRFACINISDPRYSDRCNPIHRRLLKSKQEAMDAVYTIYFNLDKKSAQKQDFFQMSAMSLTVGALWFLRNYKDGIYCSFPHLVELIQQPDVKLFTILGSYPELRYWTSAFADALEKESFDQLSGQTASARIPLGKCATDEMFWVMTDPDNTGVNLKVNLPEEVTILNIANNPETQKTNAPALGLYLSQSAKLINDHGRVPCAFHIDEFPTTYINGLNTLIATARSNKVCTVLSAQDYTQLVLEYGKDEADSIFNTIDNIITGKVAIDTAKKMSEAIGKFNYTTQSISINQESTSTSFNTQRDYIVPPEDISQLSQGEFCGVVSDTFKQKIDLKAFRGDVNPLKDNMKGVAFPMVYPNLTPEDLQQNVVLIQTQINDLVKEEMSRIENDRQNAIEIESDNVRNSIGYDNVLPFQNLDSLEEELVFKDEIENEVIDFDDYNFNNDGEKIEIEIEEIMNEEEDDNEFDQKRFQDLLRSIPDINDLKKNI